MLINPERKNSLLGLELVVVFVGLLAHCFATIVNFQWFSKLPSPLNAMVARNHWDQWFFDAFGIRQPLITMVLHHWSDDGMVTYHCRSLVIVKEGVKKQGKAVRLTYSFCL